jgi:ribosome maturation protein Sdo1
MLLIRREILLRRETNLDDVLQINNVFMNVSKGEVARHGDLDKAFGKAEVNDIVKEVCNAIYSRPLDCSI